MSWGGSGGIGSRILPAIVFILFVLLGPWSGLWK